MARKLVLGLTLIFPVVVMQRGVVDLALTRHGHTIHLYDVVLADLRGLLSVRTDPEYKAVLDTLHRECSGDSVVAALVATVKAAHAVANRKGVPRSTELAELLPALATGIRDATLAQALSNPQQALFFLQCLLHKPQGDAFGQQGVPRDCFDAAARQSIDELRGWLLPLWDNQCLSVGSSLGGFPTEDSELAAAIDAAHRHVLDTALADGAELPVVTAIVRRWASAWFATPPVDTFYTFLMHASYSAEALAQDLMPVVYRARRAQRLSHSTTECPVFCVFLDEINTTAALGVVSDLFIDGELPTCGVDGATRMRAALPPNIFWVGAANPHRLGAGDGGANADAFRAYYQVRGPSRSCCLYLLWLSITSTMRGRLSSNIWDNVVGGRGTKRSCSCGPLCW